MACFTPTLIAAAPVDALAAFGPLTPAERRVIALAKTDSLATLRTPGPLARLLSRLLGLPQRNRLADPHLEALRQAAVLYWHDLRQGDRRCAC